MRWPSLRCLCPFSSRRRAASTRTPVPFTDARHDGYVLALWDVSLPRDILATLFTRMKDDGARQKGYAEALAAFATMQPDENGPRAAFALYHQGRMQVLLGKRAEAKALFEKARTANPDMIRDIAPEARTLEGYLFPDTYKFNPGTPPRAARTAAMSEVTPVEVSL